MAPDARPDEPSVGAEPPPSPHHSTEHRLSDIHSGGRDRLAEAAFLAGSAATGLACAAWLASWLRLPGTALDPEVVGRLATEPGGASIKAFETAFFYGAVALVPLAVVLGARFLRGTVRAPGAVFAGGCLAVGDVARRFASAPGVGGFPPSAVLAPLAMLLVPLALVPLGRRMLQAARGVRDSAAAARILGPDRAARVPNTRAWFAGTASLLVFLLAVGPRTAPDLALVPALFRLAAFTVVAALLATGLWLVSSGPAQAQDRTRPARRAVSALSVLLIARFVPAPVAPPWILGILALAALLLGVTVALGLARTRDASAPPATAPPGGFLFWSVFAPALVVVLVFHHNVHGNIDTFHTGEWLVPGAELLRGAVPYRDLYLQHGLIQNALAPFVAFRLLGDDLTSDRLASNLLYALAHAAFFLMCARLLRSRLLALGLTLALATPGLILGPRFLPLFLALACVLADLGRGRDAEGRARARGFSWALCGAGVFAALGVFYSLDVGAYGTAGILAFLLVDAAARRGERARVLGVAAFLAGLVLGALPFVVYLGAHDALFAFLRNSRDQTALQLSVWGLPFPGIAQALDDLHGRSFGEALARGPLLAWLEAAAFVAAGAWLALRAARRRFGPTCWKALLLLLPGVALFRSALGRSDAGHFAYAMALFWPLAALLAEAAWRTRPSAMGAPSVALVRRALPATLLAALLLAAYSPLYGMVQHWARIAQAVRVEPGDGTSYVPLRRMRGVLVPTDTARVLTAFASWLDERLEPGAPIADFSNLGAVYFFLERPVATRYVLPVYAATPQMQARAIEDLERVRPRYLVTSNVLGSDQVDRVPMSQRLPLLARWLGEHYQPLSFEAFGEVYVWSGAAN